MKLTGKNRRSCLGLLLLLALTLRALIPDGFMPGQDGHGAPQIVICPGGMHHMNHDGKNGGAHENCPYAPVLAQGMPGFAPVVQAAALHGDAPLFTVADFLADAAHLKPWFSRGPPAILTHI